MRAGRGRTFQNKNVASRVPLRRKIQFTITELTARRREQDKEKQSPPKGAYTDVRDQGGQSFDKVLRRICSPDEEEHSIIKTLQAGFPCAARHNLRKLSPRRCELPPLRYMCALSYGGKSGGAAIPHEKLRSPQRLRNFCELYQNPKYSAALL